MSEVRTPEAGEVQIVVLIGVDTFIGWAPATQVGGIMDAFERRAGLTIEDRTSQLSHAAIRVKVATSLREPGSARLFTDVLAAGCLWLALRHWSNSDDMAEGLDRQMSQTGSAVVTASIPDNAPPGMAADTAWAFMVGSRVHDGRPRLATVEAGRVELMTGE